MTKTYQKTMLNDQKPENQKTKKPMTTNQKPKTKRQKPKNQKTKKHK